MEGKNSLPGGRDSVSEFRNKLGAWRVTVNSTVSLEGKGQIGKEGEKEMENTTGNILLESPYFQVQKCVLNFSKKKTPP